MTNEFSDATFWKYGIIFTQQTDSLLSEFHGRLLRIPLTQCATVHDLLQKSVQFGTHLIKIACGKPLCRYEEFFKWIRNGGHGFRMLFARFRDNFHCTTIGNVSSRFDVITDGFLNYFKLCKDCQEERCDIYIIPNRNRLDLYKVLCLPTQLGYDEYHDVYIGNEKMLASYQIRNINVFASQKAILRRCLDLSLLLAPLSLPVYVVEMIYNAAMEEEFVKVAKNDTSLYKSFEPGKNIFNDVCTNSLKRDLTTRFHKEKIKIIHSVAKRLV